MQTFTAYEAMRRFYADRLSPLGVQVLAPTDALALSGDLQGSGGPRAMSHQVMP